MEEKIIDLTNYRELQADSRQRIMLSCSIRLDKKTMLNILQSDAILINGKYYEVPEHNILNLLINKQYGETKLELEEVTF